MTSCGNSLVVKTFSQLKWLWLYYVVYKDKMNFKIGNFKLHFQNLLSLKALKIYLIISVMDLLIMLE